MQYIIYRFNFLALPNFLFIVAHPPSRFHCSQNNSLIFNSVIEIISDSKKSWLKNIDSLKKESEEFLQRYFKEKLSKIEDSDDEPDDWIVVKPKKRRTK